MLNMTSFFSVFSQGSTLVKIEDVIENIFVGEQVEDTDASLQSWWVGK